MTLTRNHWKTTEISGSLLNTDYPDSSILASANFQRDVTIGRVIYKFRWSINIIIWYHICWHRISTKKRNNLCWYRVSIKIRNNLRWYGIGIEIWYYVCRYRIDAKIRYNICGYSNSIKAWYYIRWYGNGSETDITYVDTQIALRWYTNCIISRFCTCYIRYVTRISGCFRGWS